jgi:hypothetical protein
MKINKEKIISIIQILSKEINDNFNESIFIEKEDFYWAVKMEEKYNPLKDPDELRLGQVSDDWEELLRLLESDEIPISYDFLRLSEILSLIYLKSRDS